MSTTQGCPTKPGGTIFPVLGGLGCSSQTPYPYDAYTHARTRPAGSFFHESGRAGKTPWSSSSQTQSSAGTARASGCTGDSFRGPVLLACSPPIPAEVQALIRRFANENGWRARKVQAELEKLGFSVSLATVSRYLPKRNPDHDPRQRWKTFLRNHKDGIAAMDFIVVPTVRFRLLYVWFVIGHGRREILHFGVTAHPTSPWVVQQLREAFPDNTTPRFLIYDNDSIFSDRVTESIKNIGIEPQRTAYRSPWQNGIAERWVGSARRELLDHVIVMNERHLHHLLREYVDYYNEDRVHTRLRDSPIGRPTEYRPSSKAQIVGLPRVGGLHHRYEWQKAA